MFIDLGLPFEFKLRRSETYVAPPELWILCAAANYKHRAPTGLKKRGNPLPDCEITKLIRLFQEAFVIAQPTTTMSGALDRRDNR